MITEFEHWVDCLLSYIQIMKAIFFQDPIGRKIRTTVIIRWCFVQRCCVMSLVCPSIATHHMCQFWACSELVNMPKTIESPAKCGERTVIRFLYSEKATRNFVLKYCPPSWQCSAAQCRCNKEATKAFSMGCISSTPSSPQIWLRVVFISFFVWNGRSRTTFWHNELKISIENYWLKAQAAGFYDENIGT